MTLYYVDTRDGSDAATGTSWASAWKSCYPLKALYSGVTSVQNLEVRFAKTPPMQTDCTLDRKSSGGYSALTGREADRGRYSRIYLGSVDASGYSKFTVDANSTFSVFDFDNGETYGPYVLGTQPVGTDRLEVVWFTKAANSLSCVLHLYDRSPGSADPDTPFTSLALPAPTLEDFRRVLAVDNIFSNRPAGSTHIGWRLEITNPTGTSAVVYLCPLLFSYAADSPKYDGFSTLFVPNSRYGLPFCVTNWTSATLSGGVARAEAIVNVPFHDEFVSAVTGAGLSYDISWSVYRWEPWPYSRSLALLGDATSAGTASVPLKLSGGWDKALDVVNGLTVLDVKNLQWFSPAISLVGLDIRDIAVAGNTFPATDVYASSLMCTAPATSLDIVTGYAEGVHISNPAGNFVHVVPNADSRTLEQQEGYYAALDSALLYHTKPSSWASVTIKRSSCGVGRIFGGNCAATEISESAFIGSIKFHQSLVAYDRCTFHNVASDPSAAQSTLQGSAHSRLYDCDVINHKTPSFLYGNTYVFASMENCRLWGGRTGPAASVYLAKNLTHYVTSKDTSIKAHPVCVAVTYEWDEALQTWSNRLPDTAVYDGLSVVLSPGAAVPDSLFVAYGVKLSNSSISSGGALNEVADDGGATPHTYNATTIELHNVDLTTTSAAGPVGGRVIGSNIRMHGPWTSLCGPSIADIEIDGLSMTHASTRIFSEKSRLLGTQGAHTATYVTGVSSPQTDALYLIGTPATYYPPNGLIGGAQFYPFQPRTPAGAMFVSTSHGDVWANSFIAVQRQLTAGVELWKLTARSPCGAPQVASFPVGTVEVASGVPVTFEVTVRRTTCDILCAIFIRPNNTRDWVPGTDTAETNVLQDCISWQSPSGPVGADELLSVVYTPARAGLIRLHAGCRGVAGAVAYFSGFKVVK